MNRLIWKDVLTIFNNTAEGYAKSVLRNVYYEENSSSRNNRPNTETAQHDKCVIKHVYVKADGGKKYISAEEWKNITDEADYDKFWTAIANESYAMCGETDIDSIETLRNQNKVRKVMSVSSNTHGTVIMRGIVLKLER